MSNETLSPEQIADIQKQRRINREEQKYSDTDSNIHKIVVGFKKDKIWLKKRDINLLLKSFPFISKDDFYGILKHVAYDSFKIKYTSYFCRLKIIDTFICLMAAVSPDNLKHCREILYNSIIKQRICNYNKQHKVGFTNDELADFLFKYYYFSPPEIKSNSYVISTNNQLLVRNIDVYNSLIKEQYKQNHL